MRRFVGGVATALTAISLAGAASLGAITGAITGGILGARRRPRWEPVGLPLR